MNMITPSDESFGTKAKLLESAERILLTTTHLNSWHPSRLFNMAYGIYAYEDPDQEGTTWQKLGERDAMLLVHGYAELEKDKIFLEEVRAIVLSYSRTIFRGKRQWKREMDSSQRRYDADREYRKSVRSQTFWQNLVMLLVRAGFLFGLGAALATMLSGYLPMKVADKTGEIAPSVVAGFLVIAVKNLIMKFWSDLRQSRAEADYDWSRSHADEDYEIAQRDAFRLHWDQLCHAYLNYSGEHYEHTPSFMSVIESNLRTRARWRVRSYFRTMGTVAWVTMFIRKVLLKTLRRNNKTAKEL